MLLPSTDRLPWGGHPLAESFFLLTDEDFCPWTGEQPAHTTHGVDTESLLGMGECVSGPANGLFLLALRRWW